MRVTRSPAGDVLVIMSQLEADAMARLCLWQADWTKNPIAEEAFRGLKGAGAKDSEVNEEPRTWRDNA